MRRRWRRSPRARAGPEQGSRRATRGAARSFRDGEVPRLSWLCDLVSEFLECPPDQPGNVHLGDPDLDGDLRLGQALDEPELDDPALTLVERAQPRRKQLAVLGRLVAALLVVDQVDQLRAGALVRVDR